MNANTDKQACRFIVLTATQKIGHLSLFVDVLTNFVVTALLGLSKRQPGGKTCKETFPNIITF